MQSALTALVLVFSVVARIVWVNKHKHAKHLCGTHTNSHHKIIVHTLTTVFSVATNVGLVYR